MDVVIEQKIGRSKTQGKKGGGGDSAATWRASSLESGAKFCGSYFIPAWSQKRKLGGK